ncbi:MAG: amidase, partial [Vicinamibacterales bacterium]
FGTTNEESAYGLVRHPLDPTRSPGGSSGGSAVSVATGMAWASIGTDTGGSVRIPSAACGLVGLKPGFGEVPVEGIIPLSTTLDHVGPLCRSVGDARIVYGVLRGQAPSVARKEARGLRLGIPREYFLSVLDADVAAGFEATCARLRDAGVVIDEVSIRHAADIAPVYLHIVLAEAAAYHARTLESRPGDYTPNVRLRLEMGRYILAEDYARALRGREMLRHEVDAALGDRDGLLLPALAVPATTLGADTVRVGSSTGVTDEPIRNITLRLTHLFNVTGHPAITLPCGATPEGLPIGAQIVGHSNRTPDLLDVASALERYVTPDAATPRGIPLSGAAPAASRN